MSNDDTDAPRGPSAAAKEAADGMEITPTRLTALRAVRDKRVQYDAKTNAFHLDGQRVTRSVRRTYGEIRRRGLIKQARGEGLVAVVLTSSGTVIVDDADAAEAEASHAEPGEQSGGNP